jgi:hypothetical protein
VHLAEEGVVNSKGRETLCTLIAEKVVRPDNGLLRVFDPAFTQFLTRAVPHKIIEEWEKSGADVRSLSLRRSFLALGIVLAAFLIYSQSDVLNTWAPLIGGVAALIPAFMRLLDTLRGGSKVGG